MSEAGRERRRLFPDVSAEVREELEFHRAMLIRENERRGMTPAQAEEAALRRLGDVQRLRGECERAAQERDRTMRRTEMTAELYQDVRYGLRQLLRAPSFTVAAVLTLALGIGATAAMYSAVDAVLLRPLPLPAADRLVVPQSASLVEDRRWNITYADYEDWLEAGVFDAVAAFRRTNANIAGEESAEQVRAAAVTQDFFAVLRVGPVLGTTFRADDFVYGAPVRAVLSYGVWQRVFGADPGIIGRTVQVAGLPREIAGVLPDGLGYPDGVDVWFPLQLSPEAHANDQRRDNFIYEAIARLAPGRTLQATRAELATLAGLVSAAEPVTRRDVTVTAVPLDDFLVGSTVSRALWVLFAAVAMVLLIACVNVANLLLGRSAVRAHELAVRVSLGAGRGRIVRQLVTESVVLSLLGGAGGVLVALAATRAIVAGAPAGIPRLEGVAVDIGVLGFTLAAAVFCALLFGVVPAVRTAGHAVSSAAAAGSRRATWGRTARRRRGALVVAEIALSVMLLIGAALLLRSFANLRGTDAGFDTDGVLTLALALQGERYMTQPRPEAYAELVARIEAVPGVRSAAFAGSLPLGGGGFYLGRSFLHDAQAEPPATEATSAMWAPVTPGYFATLRLPLVRGRAFTDLDHADAPPVMIVSREFARDMFGTEDVIGRRVRSWRDENVYREIVGVVGDVRYFGAGDEIRAAMYVPHRQDPWGSLVAVIRTDVPPLAVADDVRAAVRAFDASLGVARLRTMQDIFDESIASSRFMAFLLGVFAALALLLALVGVYGVLAWDIAQRTREIGIRLALGARRADIRALVLRDAAVVLGAGAVAGVGGALVLTRFAGSLLYGVTATDPLTFAGVTLLVAGVALLAILLTSRRAAAIDPARALGAE